MAGNVREWAWNAEGDRRYTLGGGWSDPTYLYMGPDALDPMDRSPILGSRCALYEDPAAQGRIRRDPERRAGCLEGAPGRRRRFPIYQRLFDYDLRELGSKVESVDDRSEHWRSEKVSFAAA